jgi:hypothetical protein
MKIVTDIAHIAQRCLLRLKACLQRGAQELPVPDFNNISDETLF